LPESNAPCREEALHLLESVFGVARSHLTDFCFYEHNDEVWVVGNGPPVEIAAQRPAGLRAFRRMPRGLKPTSVFLVVLGERITQSRVEVSTGQLRTLLLGSRLEGFPKEAYVAISYRGDVVGCGRTHHGTLQALIPTGRRRELLDILDASER